MKLQDRMRSGKQPSLKIFKVSIVLISIACLFMIGYFYISYRSPAEPPEVNIMIGDKQLNYVVGKNEWNGAKYDREGVFQTIMKKYSASELPYINIPSTVTIKFTKNPPSKITILDILIDDKGNQIYSEKESINIAVVLKNGKTSFEINKHRAASLSSYYAEGKSNIRGFSMIAKWGQNECEYAFAIRTD